MLFALLLLQLAPDVSNAKVASTAVAGKLDRKTFIPTRVELKSLGLSKVSVKGKVVDQSRQYMLTFRSGKEFFADQEITVWVTFDDGKPIAPRSWHWKPTNFGTDAYRAQSYPKTTNDGSVARGLASVHTNGAAGVFQDGFSANLQFVKVTGKILEGRINLVLPDRSFLNGTFKAKIVPALG